MKYKIILANQKVNKELDELPNKVWKSIDKAILKLADNPRTNQTKNLVNNPVGDYRLRVGRYRIIYDIYEDKKAIVILKIAKRSDIYK